jgi:hypothetical protein
MILQGLRLTSVLRKSEYLRVCFSDKPWLKCIPNHNDYSIAGFHFQLFSSPDKADWDWFRKGYSPAAPRFGKPFIAFRRQSVKFR